METLALSVKGLNDRKRAGVLWLADLLALAVVLIVDNRLGYRPEWNHARWEAGLGFGILFLYFLGWAGLGHFIWASIRDFQAGSDPAEADGSSRPLPPDKFMPWLYVGAVLNYLLVSYLIFYTGGMKSPFTGYASAFVIFGLFLSSSRRATVLCLAAGLGLLWGLTWHSVAAIAERYAIPIDSWTVERQALAWIGTSVMLVGAICNVRRKGRAS